MENEPPLRFRFNLGLGSETAVFSCSRLLLSVAALVGVFSSLTGFGCVRASSFLGACADGGVLGVAGVSTAGVFGLNSGFFFYPLLANLFFARALRVPSRRAQLVALYCCCFYSEHRHRLKPLIH